MTPTRGPYRGQVRRMTAALLLTGLSSLPTSCGSRTGLFVDDAAELEAGQDAGVDGEAGDAQTVACTPGNFGLNKANPAVMFVLDRSQSMTTRFGAGRSRWSVLTNALASSLPPVDDTMAIGALLYPARGSSTSSTQCTVASSADLAPATGNVSSLVSTMRGSSPEGSTPTAEAIDIAAASLRAFRAATSARALVLATDGGPDCNSALDPSTCRCVSGGRCNATRCLDDARTVERIANQAAAGLPTYVIGIQDSTDDSLVDVLDAMAVAGGRPQKGLAHRYFAASSEAELDAALVAIREQVAVCTFLITSVPDASGTISITLDGESVPYDETGTNGWTWSNRDNGEIRFVGDACSRAVVSSGSARATVSCGPPDADAADADTDVDADVGDGSATDSGDSG